MLNDRIIGKNVVIGAGSLVVMNIDTGAIIRGNPAKEKE